VIGASLVLLMLAAIYVGTIEAAFSALMKLSLRLTVERDGRAKGLGPYLDNPPLLFIPVRLLISTIVTIATMLWATRTGVTDLRGVLLLVLAMAAFVIVFEHLIPLLIIRRDPEKVLIFLLPSFNLVVKLLQPISLSLVGLIATLRRDRSPVSAIEAAALAEEDGDAAHAYLDAGEQEGLIERDERALLESIVDFGDKLVRDVMTPRPDIVAIHADATLGELRAKFLEQQYSRLPVFEETLDRIIGFVHVKDLIRLVDASPDQRVIPQLLRPAHFVPETKRVSELLKEFQRQQIQSAVVVDEYGGTAGLVTVEDLLEEIVGEIRDEYDVESEPVTDEGNGSFVFGGGVDIDEVSDRLGVEIPREGFGTVGGFLMAHLGRVPSVGESLVIDGLHIDVLEAERRRVTRVRIRKAQAEAAQAELGLRT
jgi:putative hemolysin